MLHAPYFLLFAALLAIGLAHPSNKTASAHAAASPKVENATRTTKAQEELCVRMHNNTAFLGVEPFARLLLYSANDCRKNCIEIYPKCVAVMFYFLHNEEKNHVCYLFDKNSVHEEVALVPEKPISPFDQIRSLEIVVDCHEFDAFPPLEEPFVSSTDVVSKKKRHAGYDRPVQSMGPWTGWSACIPRAENQFRSQTCEYGRYVQRRRCTAAQPFHAGHAASSYYHGTPVSVPYPPGQYAHPSWNTDAYARIMASHSDQMLQSCCFRQHYYQHHPVIVLQQQQPMYTVQQAQPVAQVVQQVVPVMQQSVAQVIQPAVGIMAQPAPAPVSWACPRVCEAPYIPTPYMPAVPAQPPQGPYVPIVQPQPPYVPEIPSQPVNPPTRPPMYPTHPPVYPTHPPVYPPRTTPRPTFPPRPTLPPTLPPVIQVWSEWSEWSRCSSTCGTGSHERHRTCRAPFCDGPSVEQRSCDDLEPCETWSQWSQWSSCTATCGNGERSRSRYCTLGTGNCVGDDYQQNYCQEAPCPEWSEWEEWSPCSVTCGYGTKSRSRVCNGHYCQGQSSEERACDDLEPCSHWAQWQEWSYCSVSCEMGTKTRTRICIGSYCPGSDMEEEMCTEAPCPMWTDWESWSSCSATCGFGTKQRQRICHGIFCPGARMEQAQCEMSPCSAWSNWDEWSECSTTCGDGTQRRFRNCINGRDCPGYGEESRECSNEPCAHWTDWAEWSACSAECGPGEKRRERECESDDGHLSNACRGLSIETVLCDERPCCEWGEWTKWSGCNKECGGGTLTRTRMCQRPGGFFGSCQCPGDDREHLSCNNQQCPVPVVTHPPPTPPQYEPYPTQTPPPYQPLPPVTPPPYQPYPPQTPPPYQPQPPQTPPPYQPQPPQTPPPYQPQPPPYQPQRPQNCQWTNWGAWGECTNYCDYGVSRRFRNCVGEQGCFCYGQSYEDRGCKAPAQAQIGTGARPDCVQPVQPIQGAGCGIECV